MAKTGWIGTAAGAALLFTTTAWAGDLEPPGPPAPTMKTLDEVEARIPIHDADMPLTITTKGSYYFAEDVVAPEGIVIATGDVTVDLNGFRLSGLNGDGISAAGFVENVTVRNGRVDSWGGAGVALLGSNTRVIDVVSRNNGGDGIVVGTSGEVRDSLADANGGTGIFSGFNSVVARSVARDNAEIGIEVRAGSVLGHSTASGNQSHGFSMLGGGSIVHDCNSFDNDGNGFNGTNGIQIRDCLALNNTGDGIVVQGGCTVRDNLVRNNGTFGIRSTSTRNRFVNNSVVGHTTGFFVIGANTGFGNSASDNGTNYSVGGTDFGPIGGASTATSPWANIEY